MNFRAIRWIGACALLAGVSAAALGPAALAGEAGSAATLVAQQEPAAETTAPAAEPTESATQPPTEGDGLEGAGRTVAPPPHDAHATDHAADHGAGHAAGHGAGHDDHHIGHADMSPELTDPTELRTDLAIWTAVIFLIVLVILWRTAWGPILAGLQKREEGIAANIANAQRQNDEARRLLEQYERKLAAAQGQVREIMDEARRDADHTQQEILARARADAQAERDRALRDIDTAKQQALKDLAEHSANLAIDLAGKLLRDKLTPSDQQALVQDALGRFVSEKGTKGPSAS